MLLDNLVSGRRSQQFDEPVFLLDFYELGEFNVEPHNQVSSSVHSPVPRHSFSCQNSLCLRVDYLVKVELNYLATQLFLGYGTITTSMDLASRASMRDTFAVYIRLS